jgi:hypothetical protein
MLSLNFIGSKNTCADSFRASCEKWSQNMEMAMYLEIGPSHANFTGVIVPQTRRPLSQILKKLQTP